MTDDGTQQIDASYLDHADRVLAYLLHRSDPDTAEDLVRQVFVRAVRRHPDAASASIGWLLATAGRLLRTSRRGPRQRDLLIQRMTEDAAETEDLDQAELKFRFIDAMSALAGADREVLTVASWYGLSSSEAAEVLRCSPRSYAARLRRAQDRLARQLDESQLDAGLELFAVGAGQS